MCIALKPLQIFKNMKPQNHKIFFIIITIVSICIFLISLSLTIVVEKEEMAESADSVIEIPTY